LRAKTANKTQKRDSSSLKQASQAILLINLGSPSSTQVKDVRRYLGEFLMDGLVIDVPYVLRWIIVHLFILPFRPKRSADAYSKIWTDKGSPLIENTRKFAEALQKVSKQRIFWAMRYGSPSIKAVLQSIAETGTKNVRIVPLYPHHALSSNVTAIREAERHAAELGLDTTAQPVFYDSEAHVSALVKQVARHIKKDDFVLFSYHGLPVRHITKADSTGAHCLVRENCCEIDSPAHATCYRYQVLQTTERVARGLRLQQKDYAYSFQSRLGRAEWLRPMTSEYVVELAHKGVRNLAVVTPAFVADNLETLEEVNIQLREIFLSAGGERFTFVPCLNDSPDWVKGFSQILNKS
jgi:protoporphyrin/coproporphyrin ferrochelatase